MQDGRLREEEERMREEGWREFPLQGMQIERVKKRRKLREVRKKGCSLKVKQRGKFFS
jgi:hypothetical protein